ncbi:MAG: ABC transporter permease [Chitinophagales bacterium]
MNLEFFITKRIAFSQSNSFSGFIIKIAVVAIALSMTVMVITTSMVNGFQNEISRKIFGFWGHIHIRSFDSNQSYEDINPISKDQHFYPAIDTIPGIRHIQVYANKAGIIKTDDEIEGIIMKGISTDFDWDFFQEYLIKGRPMQLNDSSKVNEVVLSQVTANRLNLDTGKSVIVHFIESAKYIPKRKLKVVGIYKTGLEEYDEKYALMDIKHIQRINRSKSWDEGMVGGFEVFLDDVEDLDKFSELVYYEIIGQDLLSQNIREINPNIFEWLDLQDTNETVILTLMVVVAIINMITALLILILDRTNMIGILKALGADNWRIRKIFLYNAAYIIGWGLLIGNVVGIGFCWLQDRFGFIQLDEESYYLAVAPVDINLGLILMLNLATLIICVVSLVLPSYMVTTINPIKAIRFK